MKSSGSDNYFAGRNLKDLDPKARFSLHMRDLERYEDVYI